MIEHWRQQTRGWLSTEGATSQAQDHHLFEENDVHVLIGEDMWLERGVHLQLNPPPLNRGGGLSYILSSFIMLCFCPSSEKSGPIHTSAKLATLNNRLYVGRSSFQRCDYYIYNIYPHPPCFIVSLYKVGVK